jgi:hypothetical protein
MKYLRVNDSSVAHSLLQHKGTKRQLSLAGQRRRLKTSDPTRYGKIPLSM